MEEYLSTGPFYSHQGLNLSRTKPWPLPAPQFPQSCEGRVVMKQENTLPRGTPSAAVHERDPSPAC